MIDDEQIKSDFANHVASVKQLDDDTQILVWKKPGTRWYEITYVFYKNMIFITGDLYDAVVNCTWYTSWDYDWEKIELSYFAEKMSTREHGIYVWDSDEAVDDLKDEYKGYFDELNEEEFNEMTEYIKNETLHYLFIDENKLEDIPYSDKLDDNILLQYCLAIKHAENSSSQDEYVYGIQNDPDFEDFNDFWEWGYNCGKRLNGCIKVYLIGLQMAYKQLKEKLKINEN